MAHSILLVFPRCEPDWPDPRKRLGFPLAILTLARSLVAAGFEVELVDENVIARVDDALAAASTPLFVGISCLGGGQIEAALDVARATRRLHPGVPIVWGGWNPTLLPHLYEDAAMRPWVDVVARGRGEATALAIAQRYAEGRDLEGVAGVSWRDASGALRREVDARFDDPTDADHLPWHLVRHPDRYLWRDGIANHVSSYGCPHRCSFCGIPIGIQTFRATANERVVQHLERLRDLGAKTVVFYDDNFFTSKPRVLDLAERLAASGLGLRWYSNGRLDQVSRLTDDELAALARSGCAGLNIGYETGDQAVADRAKKDVTVGSMKDLAPRLHAAGIHLSINFMIGLPGETPESLARSLETLFLLHARHPAIEVCWYMFMPSPGTESWRELEAAGILTAPRSLAEHARLQYLYLEHPWYYVSPPSNVFREWRAALKSVAWWFHVGYAAKPPASLFGRALRRLARFRFARRAFRWPIEWWVAFQWNRWRTTWRIAAARRRFARGELPRDVGSSAVPGSTGSSGSPGASGRAAGASIASPEETRAALPWARGAM